MMYEAHQTGCRTAVCEQVFKHQLESKDRSVGTCLFLLFELFTWVNLESVQVSELENLQIPFPILHDSWVFQRNHCMHCH